MQRILGRVEALAEQLWLPGLSQASGCAQCGPAPPGGLRIGAVSGKLPKLARRLWQVWSDEFCPGVPCGSATMRSTQGRKNHDKGKGAPEDGR